MFSLSGEFRSQIDILQYSLVILRLQEVELLLDALDGLDDVELEGGRRGTAPGLAGRTRGATARHLKEKRRRGTFSSS